MENWRKNAACMGADPEIFAPVCDQSPTAYKAREICWAACPVRTECLDDALATSDDTTIRGGYSPEERRRFMRHRLEIQS